MNRQDILGVLLKLLESEFSIKGWLVTTLLDLERYRRGRFVCLSAVASLAML
jgi:hypothetical protein